MDKKLSAKNKIIIVAFVWVILGLVCFLFLFTILDSTNEKAFAEIEKQKTDQAALLAEQQSESRAKWDLEELAKKPVQPKDFFNKDLTFDKELEVLESLGKKYNVDLKKSGIGGTVKSAQSAKTTTPLVVIPYNMSLTGNLSDVVDLIENIENLHFITNVSSIAITAADLGKVNVSLSANFYLRKE